MSPRKRQQSESLSAPPRKSARLAAQTTSPTGEQARGLSVISTEAESPETLPSLLEAAKARIAKYQPYNRVHEKILQPSLNAFIKWLPEGGQESLARDVINATTDDDLYSIFHNLFTGLAVPMKARSRKSSVSDSPHPKRQENVDVVAATLDKPQTRDENFRDMCLQRDKYCCIATGHMDTDYWAKIGFPEGTSTGRLEAAHIIPFAYSSWDKSSEPPRDTANAWEVLWRCFPNVRKAGMRVDNINDLRNGITLKNYIHEEFGRFSLAFKPTKSENEYEPKYFSHYPPQERAQLLENVKFTRAEDTPDLELPDAALLDCHYRLAEILNASGMAEVIDRYHQDWDNIRGTTGSCLKQDGSTDIGRLLSVGLWERVGG